MEAKNKPHHVESRQPGSQTTSRRISNADVFSPIREVRATKSGSCKGCQTFKRQTDTFPYIKKSEIRLQP